MWSLLLGSYGCVRWSCYFRQWCMPVWRFLVFFACGPTGAIRGGLFVSVLIRFAVGVVRAFVAVFAAFYPWRVRHHNRAFILVVSQAAGGHYFSVARLGRAVSVQRNVKLGLLKSTVIVCLSLVTPKGLLTIKERTGLLLSFREKNTNRPNHSVTN